MFKKFLKILLQKTSFLLFPGNCVLCGLPSKRNRDLCVGCEDDLPWKNYVVNPCPPIIDEFVAVFDYAFPIKQLIVGLKFANKQVYGRVIGELMAEQVEGLYENSKLPQAIIPVPLHRKRLKKRGYNQAFELAVPVAKRLSVRLDTTCCVRRRNTMAQSELSEHMRRKNLKNAFLLTKQVDYKYVAIVDDVVTTGATIIELCKLLKANGVDKVDVWCCAKT